MKTVNPVSLMRVFNEAFFIILSLFLSSQTNLYVSTSIYKKPVQIDCNT